MSTYPNVKFVTSAAEAHQLAPDTGREIAFAGRSNSGQIHCDQRASRNAPRSRG